MYIMYVDESGDCGVPPPCGSSPTTFFCLTGLVVHELRWSETLDSLLGFRHWLKKRYHVYLDDELHAAELIGKPAGLPQSLRAMRKHERLAIVRHHADQIGKLSAVRLINVCVDKRGLKNQSSDDIFRKAWYALFQRFENTILRHNFPGPPNDHERGIVFPDATDGRKLRQFLTEMRVRNPLWVRRRDGNTLVTDAPIKVLIEDPVCRDSKDSYFVQAADCAAFLFKQSIDPSSFMKKHGGNAYFHIRLKPVLCLQASNSHPLGIVRL